MTKTITIDGPAGVGKSTVARLLSQRLGFLLLDTGAIYRSLALFAYQKGVSYAEEDRLARLAMDLPIQFRQTSRKVHVFLGDQDVTFLIRTPAISEAASYISPYPAVRAALLPVQRVLAKRDSCVVEGRDTGTVVCPDAFLKIFLTGRKEVRAQRRKDELEAAGISMSYEQIFKEQNTRDERDADRQIAPLKCPRDAVVIDTSDLELEQVVDAIEQVYNERLFLAHSVT